MPTATERKGSHRRQTVDGLIDAFHRLAADGYKCLGSHRRQTVDALVSAFHRLAAGGYECCPVKRTSTAPGRWVKLRWKAFKSLPWEA